MGNSGLVLVTGATGYIGGRLVPRLIQEGHQVRVLVRREGRVRSRSWFDRVEVATGDAFDTQSLSQAMGGVDCAYYLIHSMGSGPDFRNLDITAARNFAQAAKEAGVRRIIYLGGLGKSDAGLSPHLRSRQETGRMLRESGVPVTEFRAAVVVGSGSVSFEMIRYLVERLPVMVCPRWIYSRIQPIAVGDLLEYLAAALTTEESEGKIIEVGGKEVTTYRGMMLGYAKARGLKRLLLPVPVLTPRLSSYWVHWVTPIPARISGALIEGLRNEVIVTNDLARTLFPQIQPLSYTNAIQNVVDDLDEGRVETAWSDASGLTAGSEPSVRMEVREGMMFERRKRHVHAPAEEVYRVIAGIGGARGWYHANWMWRMRGMTDRLLGGAGLRRGRRHPDDLRVGDSLDFWRVDALEEGRLLRLRAEMKLPGHAWLQYEVREDNQGATLVEQTAAFLPKGLAGLAYWYALYPIHAWIFSGIVKEIGRRSERLARDRE